MHAKAQKTIDVVGWGAALGAGTLWAVGISASKFLVGQYPALPLLTGQLFGSTLMLWGLHLLKRRPAVTLRQALPSAVVGILEPGLAYIVFLYGLKHVDASIAAILSALEPALILLFCRVIWRDRVTGQSAILIGLAMLGAAIASGYASHSEDLNLGALGLVFLGVALAALYVTLTRKIGTGLASETLIAIQHTASLSVIAAASFVVDGVHTPLWHDMPLVLLSGIVQYALPFWFYLIALRRLPVAASAVSLNVIPVFGVILGVVLLGESFSLVQIGGAMLVMGAAWKIARLEESPRAA